MERASENEANEGRAEGGSSGTPSDAHWWRFWNGSRDEPQARPREWAEALVEVRLTPEWTGTWSELSLLRNSEPLPLRQEKRAGKVRVIAPWPRSGPGHYQLRLLGGKRPQETRVTIWPETIRRGEYEALLRELEYRLPVQIAIALKGAGGLAGVDFNPQVDTTLEQEWVRLRRAAEGTEQRLGLAAALTRLADQPHRILTDEERWVRRGRARPPRADRLGQAFARPGNVEAGRLRRVADRRVRHTADVYENRMVRQFTRQVRLRLRRIEPLLRDQHADLAEEAHTLRERLDQARRQAHFLDEVAELSRPPTHASMVLQNRPLYRAVFEGYLESQKSVTIALDAPALDAPLRNLPSLYQLWCTLHVIEVAIREAGRVGYQVERSGLFQRTGGFLSLRLGPRAARFVHPDTGVTVQLWPERTYSASSEDALHSVSYAQHPDIAIEVTGPSGEQAVYLFDPKYKLDAERSHRGDDASAGTPKKPDIDKMHAYRDAIRGRTGERVVRYAAILYPGATETFSSGLEAITARPGQTDLLQRRVGRVMRRALSASAPSQDLTP